MTKREPEDTYLALLADHRLNGATYPKIEQIRIGASLFHLLPTLKAEEYPQFISKLHLHQRYSAMEMNYVAHLTPRLELDQSTSSEITADKRGVFCSFHVGSYRLVVPWLISEGHKITMLIDARVNAAIGQHIERNAYEFLTSRGMDPRRLRVRDTAMPGVLRKIFRDSCEGYSPFIYVDGNLSLTDGDKSNSVFEFLGGKISVKSGAAHLAKNLRLPLFVAIASSRPDASVGPSKSVRIKKVAEAESLALTMRQIWQSLEERLRGEPTDWESWRYIDRSLVLQPPPKIDAELATKSQFLGDRDHLIFNQSRYVLDRVGEKLILFDRKHFVAHLISSAFWEFLDSARRAGSLSECDAFESLNESTVASLRSRDILIVKGA